MVPCKRKVFLLSTPLLLCNLKIKSQKVKIQTFQYENIYVLALRNFHTVFRWGGNGFNLLSMEVWLNLLYSHNFTAARIQVKPQAFSIKILFPFFIHDLD